MDSFNYFIFITPDNTIWGVGTSRKETILDAIKNLSNYYEIGELPTKGKVINASSELAWSIWDNGYDEGMWELNEVNTAILREANVNYYARLGKVKETKLKFD